MCNIIILKKYIGIRYVYILPFKENNLLSNKKIINNS